MAMGVCNDGGVYTLLWEFYITVGIYKLWWAFLYMAMGVCNDGGVYILLWAFCIVVGVYK